MLSFIILVPACIVLLIALLASLEAAFLYVYIPVLFFFPNVYHLKMSGLPEMTFQQAALLPILLLFFTTRIFSWTFSLMDLVILSLVILCGYTEEINEPRDYTKIVVWRWASDGLFPYLIGKGLIHPYGITIPTAKQMIRCMVFNIFLSVVELRLVLNPYTEILGKFFAGQNSNLPVLYRYGTVRVTGPFLQTIFYGLVSAVSLQLNYWLSRSGYWEKNFSFIALPMKKGTFLGIILFLGLLTTFSRGPLLGAILGWIFIGVGFSKHRWYHFFLRLTLFIIIGVILLEMYDYYSTINRFRADSDFGSNIAYRTEMNAKYIKIAMEHYWFGWGSSNFPLVVGMSSVDNEYLFLFLQHGILAVGLFIFTMFWISVRLLLRGLFDDEEEIADSTLAFTLFASYLTFSVVFINVYMGMQSFPLFFLFTGWAEGFLSTSPEDTPGLLARRK